MVARHMANDLCPPLPDEQSWRFGEILAAEPERAAALETAGPPTALLESIRAAFDSALIAGQVRWGQEQACLQPRDLRAVVQLPVAPELFDKFFNARTGYRAHFRAHHEHGLEFNSRIIKAVRRTLDAELPDVVVGRKLNCEFEDCGHVQLTKLFVMTSLTRDLAKIWFCTKLIQRDGGVKDLPPGVVGPRILLDGGQSWAAPYREHGDAVGPEGSVSRRVGSISTEGSGNPRQETASHR